MVIDLNIQYNGGFLPDILLLTQAPIIVEWFDGVNITTFLVMYCIVFWFCCVCWPGMAINVSAYYNGGSLPNIILLLPLIGEPI